MSKEMENRFDGLSDEKKKEFNTAMEAHARRLMDGTFDPPKPAPNGFAHWHKTPHNIEGLHSQPFVFNEGDEGKEQEEKE